MIETDANFVSIHKKGHLTVYGVPIYIGLHLFLLDWYEKKSREYMFESYFSISLSTDYSYRKW